MIRSQAPDGTHSPPRPARDPDFYSWDVPTRREGGVCGDRGMAVGRVQEALCEAPDGACGDVHRVRVSESGRVEYIDLGVVARAYRDGAAGVVIWLAC